MKGEPVDYDETTHGYIAFRPCGCWFAICVDAPEHASDIGKITRQAAKMGGRVERWTNEAIRTTKLPHGCEKCQKPAAAQGGLF